MRRRLGANGELSLLYVPAKGACGLRFGRAVTLSPARGSGGSVASTDALDKCCATLASPMMSRGQLESCFAVLIA